MNSAELVMYNYYHISVSIEQARQTGPNSGGVAEGHLRFDKRGLR